MDLSQWGSIGVLVTVALVTTYFSTSHISHLQWLHIPSFRASLGSISKVETTRPVRKRALTLPLPEPRPSSFWSKNDGPVQQTDAQEQCLLLTKLPLEIRVMIYERVIGRRHFHLSTGERHLSTGEVQVVINSFQCKRRHKFVYDSVHGICYSHRYKGLLQLLMTCRQIYSEAIDVLYATNSFEFTQSFCFRSFVYSLPQHRFKTVRELKFYVTIPEHPLHDDKTWSDWEDLWQFFIEDLDSLRSLIIKIGMQKTVAKAIRSETKDAAMWLMPAAKAAAATVAQQRHDPNDLDAIKRTLKLVIPSGTDGQNISQDRNVPPTELQSTVIDLAEAYRLVRRQEEEKMDPIGKRGQTRSISTAAHERLMCEYLQSRMKEALYRWRPYGRLYGEEDR